MYLEYYILFIIISFLAIFDFVYQSRSFKIYTFIILTIFFIIFSSIRWNCWTDWDNYCNFFLRTKLFKGLDLVFWEIMFEPGYRLLNNLIFKYISQNYTVFLFFVNTLIISAYLIFLYRNTSNILIGVLVYYTHFLLGIGGIRQQIAIAIMLFALPLVEKRKFWLFFCIIIFGTFFHWTSIFIIFIYFLKDIYISNSKILILIFISVFIGFLLSIVKINSIIDLLPLPQIVLFKAKTYIGMGEITLSTVFKRLIVVFIVLIFKNIANVKNSSYNLFFNMIIFGNIFYFIFSGFMPEIASRVSMYYTVAELIFYPIIFDNIKKSVDNKLFFWFLLVIYCLFKLYLNLSFYENDCFIYKSIL